MKYGKKPRKHDARVAHYSRMRLTFGTPSMTPPPVLSWSKGLPDNLGVMNNDTLGCCADAAVYHQRQVQSFVVTGQIDTQPDNVVLELYEKEGGYNPADSSTDNGTCLQDLLSYWTKTGIPLANGIDKLIAYFEVDPTNFDHVREVIDACGGIYFGMNLPQTLEDQGFPKVWSVPSGDKIAGGHCMYGSDYGAGACRFDQDGVTVNSWGSWYLIDWQTWGSYVDEAYGLVTDEWVESTGRTPLGMSYKDLESIMQGIKQ